MEIVLTIITAGVLGFLLFVITIDIFDRINSRLSSKRPIKKRF